MLAEYLPSANMSPDPYWSGKTIDSLGINISSRDYLKRYCKTNGIQQLSTKDITVGGGSITQKSNNERCKELIESDKADKERKEIISKTLNEFGVS